MAILETDAIMDSDLDSAESMVTFPLLMDLSVNGLMLSHPEKTLEEISTLMTMKPGLMIPECLEERTVNAKAPERCDPNFSADAITEIHGEKVIFKDIYDERHSMENGYPKVIAKDFPGTENKIDAAYRENGKFSC
ncbi:unnamed protein product [Caretta caretta]